MLSRYNNQDRILVAIDCIVFGFEEDELELEVLLVQRNFNPEKGKWSLIGGFLRQEETLDYAANRILQHLTGVKDIFMEQLYAYSEIERDPEERTISVAYYTLIKKSEYSENLKNKYNANWFKIKETPNLIFDHNEMLSKAIRRLRRRTAIQPIGFKLLPDRFTMRQLQALYEAILDKKIDKRNFYNKMKDLKILTKHKVKDMTTSSKGSYLYSFNEQEFKEDAEVSFYVKF
ncbi:MAG: NUDIX domain-containing protein [Capnocytophaga sp.]|nr:NUDIX domain-containing protein [Capnocytophaga sp.]